jgi:hypothetical protein
MLAFSQLIAQILTISGALRAPKFRPRRMGRTGVQTAASPRLRVSA